MPLNVYFPSLDILTQVRLWGKMAKLVSEQKDLDFGWIVRKNSNPQTQWCSPNYIELGKADLDRLARPVYSEMIRAFDYMHWSCRPKAVSFLLYGISLSPLIITSCKAPSI